VDWKLMRPVMRPGQQTAADPASGTIVPLPVVKLVGYHLHMLAGRMRRLGLDERCPISG
jgi:hypothetical protein